jgi:hypothetical protein
MQLEKRKELLVRLGHYMMSKEPAWQEAKKRAQAENGWFIPEFVQLSIQT